MCKLVAAGHGDALSHLLARRRVLLVIFLHVAALFGRVHLVPAEVRDLSVNAVGQKRVDGVTEVTLAATTTPSDVAMPASLSSDLRGRGSRVSDGATVSRGQTLMSSEFRSLIIECDSA